MAWTWQGHGNGAEERNVMAVVAQERESRAVGDETG